ncbi:hypothetical protein DFH05DRAFT_1519142 [Lentinula detonsa]|uniref:Uncharacterized protein n=1 Tax=Lentinula detonsa TaxID=2804962 RepID=A0A9W8U3C0_9AGAR|nr:hypothetical protein DFH05DRAFT_1519142 [Lentinula detonsa]KAJ3989064.1 hypothetical protein F5890DRAFT_1488650 [Lentinula detonsa]
MASRRLNLHVSALNDAEYQLYTASLADITLTDSRIDGIEHDDTYFENIHVSVREARAWLRGRYSHISAATLDNILRFFSPNLSQTDMLSGGQFFAALRLVVHVESGKDVDRALAFVQAHPSSYPISRPGSPPKLQAQASQAPSGSLRRSSDSNPFSAPPQHHTFNTNHNPFSSSRSISAKSHDGAADSAPLKLPPLPPRKPAPPITGFQPPPRHGSFVPSTGGNPPPPPPKPTLLHSHSSHATSALMKQSLIASKNGKTWKQAEEQLEKERVLRVLRSSESSSSVTDSSFLNSRARSSSPNKMGSSASSSSYTSSSDNNRAPPLPRRNTNKKPPSPPMSTSSFQQIALAGKGNDRISSFSSHNPFKTSPFQPASVIDPPRYTSSPSTSPVRKSIDLPPMPPKHPDQNPNSFSNRKPPPPIPLNLPSSTISGGSGHKRTPSFTQLRNSAESFQMKTDEREFEVRYGAKPKTASPYVSTFPRDSIDSKPIRIREETTSDSTNYFNGNVFSDNSTPSRMFRSKSLHHPSPTSVANRLATAELGDPHRSPFSPLDDDTPEASPGPSPSSRRKRPESVQVLGSKDLVTNERSPKRSIDLSGSPSPNSGLSRHMSLSNPSPPNPAPSLRRHQRRISGTSSAVGLGSSSDSPLKSLAATLQPQLLSMQQQLQPHLDKARFKAEAGLSKRGFVRDHKSLIRSREEEEGLMWDGRADGWEQQSIDDDDDYEVEDYDKNRQGDQEDRTPRSMGTGIKVVGSGKGSTALNGIEKDNLKWPVDEKDGWRPL